MTRLLAVSALGEVAGGESTLLRTLPALRRRGYSVRLAVPSPGGLLEAARERAIPTVHVALGPPEKATWSSVAGLAVAPLHLLRCDVVWLNGPSTQRLVPALALTGRPAVLRFNNPVLEPPAWWRRRAYWRTVRAISVPSRAMARQCVAAGAPPEVVHVMMPPAWEEGQRPESAIRDGRAAVRIGFVGTLEPRKGVLELIKAADIFLGAHPEATLTVIGGSPPGGSGGYAEEVRRAAAAAGTRDRIELRGYVTDAAAQMGQFDLVVIPSSAEPMASVTGEAAAAGVPVVATAVGGLPEGVGEGGALVKPDDPGALAAAVNDLLDDPERRRRLAERALAGAHRFDPVRFAEAMDALFSAALRPNR